MMAAVEVVIIDGFGQIDIAGVARLASLIKGISIDWGEMRTCRRHDLSSNCCNSDIVEPLSVTNKL
jgi:hypothetical protein